MSMICQRNRNYWLSQKMLSSLTDSGHVAARDLLKHTRLHVHMLTCTHRNKTCFPD